MERKKTADKRRILQNYRNPIVYRRPLIYVWFNRPNEIVYPMALHYLCFRPTISLRNSVFNFIALIVFVYYFLPDRRIHIQMDVPSPHYFGYARRSALRALILDNSVFVAITRRYSKTVITHDFYRFWFQLNTSHSVLLFSPVI